MKNNLSIFCLIFLTLYMGACKKDHDPNSTVSLTGKIKTVTYSSDAMPNPTGSYYYYYNNDGTVNNIKYGDGTTFTNAQSFTYTDSAGILVIKTFDAIGSLSSLQKVFTNANGRVDSISEFVPPFNQFTCTKINFDANNLPIRKIVYQYLNGNPSNPTSIQDVTFSNGNLIKKVDIPTDPINIFESFDTYDYFPITSNLTPDAFGLPYTLLNDHDLIKTQYGNIYSNGTVQTQQSWEYTFDSNNRVKSEKTIGYHQNPTTPDIDGGTRTFTYY